MLYNGGTCDSRRRGGNAGPGEDMVFNSPQFLLFFPAVTLLYFLVPRGWRMGWLLLASYFFYACAHVGYTVLLLCTTAVSFAAALLAGRRRDPLWRRGWTAAGIVSVLALLFFFKYFNFAAQSAAALLSWLGAAGEAPRLELVLPLGISFYTFQEVGYLADVCRGRVPAERNFLRYALFTAFFPKLVSGPIERADGLLVQMREGRDGWGLDVPFDFDRMRRGLLLMLWGLFLKLVLADRLALLVDTVFADYTAYNGLHLAVAAVCFSLQIYGDFGGYSAIAVGAAEVLGFRLTDNFRQPYLAVSVRDFWHRWHVSLSGWFRDYLYIPLGGSRRGKWRTRLNLMVTFLVSGLWHGASWNFVAWGGLHGLYQVAGDLLRPGRERACAALRIRREAPVWRAVRTLFTFALVTAAWVFFRADSAGQAAGFLARAVTCFTLDPDGLTGLGLDWKDLAVALAAVVTVFLADLLGRKGPVRDRVLALPLPARWAVYLLGLFAVLIFGIYGGDYDPSDFIYGREF